ncbi:MAG: RdgB/HAM1 family non-canonical purine NTP pyrophosphatase [Bacteroidales bacterium]|nr:RdgB/HAM1 family non-canonical purine NTP pyrophosphatase [Bacteroidales bacterium]
MNIQKPRLVFATHNKHKFDEIRQVIGNNMNLLSLTDIGFSGEIPEEKDSLEGNAAQKALHIFNLFGVDCFADDTGLEIEALHGEPGVYSARYAGPSCSFEDNMNLVLNKLKGVTNRKARFRTVIVLVENGKMSVYNGEIQGIITSEKRGEKGFGYDPIFIPDGFDTTFAQMTLEEKNRISHRAIAIAAFARHFMERKVQQG